MSSYLKKQCPVCKKIFYSYDCQKKTFCSRKCYLQDHKMKLILKTCICCHEKFQVSDIKSERKKKLCSQYCANKYSKGRKQSKEWIEKRMKSSKGKTDNKKGKTYEEIYGDKAEIEKQKRRITLRNKPGIRANNLKDRIRALVEYKNWRLQVFIRDKFTCQSCKKVGGNLQAHHIESFSDLIKKYKITTIEQAIRCNELWLIDNGVTLCIDCHKLTDNYFYNYKNNSKI